MSTDYLADSYALVAVFEGNDRYVRIFRRRGIATTALNVLEVYSALLRRLGPEEARAHALSLLPLVREIPPEVSLAAAEFRHSMRARHLDCSYVDAWGYSSAHALGLRFLTGDPAFKGIGNVDFVR